MNPQELDDFLRLNSVVSVADNCLDIKHLKPIRRIGNNFYWSDEC